MVAGKPVLSVLWWQPQKPVGLNLSSFHFGRIKAKKATFELANEKGRRVWKYFNLKTLIKGVGSGTPVGSNLQEAIMVLTLKKKGGLKIT